MGVFEIRRIPCAGVACTSIMDKAWISGIPPDNHALSRIDVQAAHAHGIRRIAHLPIPSFGSKRK